MARIDGLSEVMELLRRQIASQKNDGPGRFAGSQRAANKAAGRIPVNALRLRIQERIRGIDVRGGGRRNASRIFFESVLTWEFGDELIGDPRFDDLLTEVYEIINADPQLNEKLDKLLQQLSR